MTADPFPFKPIQRLALILFSSQPDDLEAFLAAHQTGEDVSLATPISAFLQLSQRSLVVRLCWGQPQRPAWS